ncbi:hypothetical protein [Bosea sp. 117]|uniref:hypothetical protein n=1 Tax=Bosea sp. 117 TaxID=1125973 RepID=UPI00049419F8|nr:hypothetical protein [Bosea sp. 117]
MRHVPLALAAFIASAAIVPAQAQDSPARIIIQKPAPKSYLDPGTVMKPGTGRYTNYVGAAQMNYPSYGPASNIANGGRYPLPDQYYLPGR